MEQAGIAQLFRANPEDAAELIRQMGVHFRAARQRPFSYWRRGETACVSKLVFPGQGAAEQQAE
eukprot:11209490-Lingulodinium_polyedra.AAC.1